jgi:hypothetical protein
MMRGRRVGCPRAGGRGLVVAVGAWLALGCDDGEGARSGGDGDAGAVRFKERTVRITLPRVGERKLDAADDGTVVYPKVTPLGGVEVCIARRRDAYALFEPFVELEPQRFCLTNVEKETTRHDGVPANSDLVVTYTKSGYEPVATTFRTDEYDVAVPSWSDNLAYFVPLVREHVLTRWLEADPPPDDANGTIAIWALAVGDWGRGYGARVFAAEADPGVEQAHGMGVEITDPDGHRVAEMETLRDRPRFVSLPEGSYRVRFSHPSADVQPFGVQEQFTITGLPTDAFDAIEVPVLAGRLSLAAVEAYCLLPTDDRPFADLSTCTLADDQEPDAR